MGLSQLSSTLLEYDFTYGESLSAGVPVYVDNGSGYIKKTTAVEGIPLPVNSEYNKLCLISDERFAMAYYDAAAEDMKVLVANIYNDTLTIEASATFYSMDTNYLDICKLDTNKFVICYPQSAANNRGVGKVCSFIPSAADLTVGEVSLKWNATGQAEYISCCQVGTDKFVIGYSWTTDELLYTIAGTVLDHTITWGIKEVVSDDISYGNAITAFGFEPVQDDEFAITYREGLGNLGQAKYGTLSGDVITLNDAYQFNSGSTGFIQNTSVDTDKLAVMYSDTGNFSYGTAVVGTVVGASAISFGDEVILNKHVTTIFDMDSCCNNKFITTYQRKTSSEYLGIAQRNTLSGNEITHSNVQFFDPFIELDSISVLKFATDRYIIVYKETHLLYTSCQIISNNLVNTLPDLIGFTKSEGVSGSLNNIDLIGNINEHQSGLETGAYYYLASDGTLDTEQSNYTAGRALSPTDILLKGITKSELQV